MLDPDGTDYPSTYTLESTNYPSNYPKNEDCEWNFEATSGKLKIILTKFNIQYNKDCSKKDYLFINYIKKYNKTYICGKYNANKILKFTSKQSKMQVKFWSDSKTQKPGFTVTINAIG